MSTPKKDRRKKPKIHADTGPKSFNEIHFQYSSRREKTRIARTLEGMGIIIQTTKHAVVAVFVGGLEGLMRFVQEIRRKESPMASFRDNIVNGEAYGL